MAAVLGLRSHSRVRRGTGSNDTCVGERPRPCHGSCWLAAPDAAASLL